MNFLRLSIFCFLITCLTSPVNAQEVDNVKKIIVQLSIDELYGGTTPFQAKFEMCFYKGYTLIKFQQETISKTFQSDGKSTLNEISSNENSSSKYFIFSNHSNRGLSYDSLKQVYGHHFSADSLLRIKAFKEAKFYNPETDKFVKTIAPVEKGTSLIELFTRPSATITGKSDTLIIHFTDSFKHIPYSLSKEFDAQNKGKVYKIEYYYQQEPKNKSSKPYHNMKAVFEYHEIKNNDVWPLDYFGKFIAETTKE